MKFFSPIIPVILCALLTACQSSVAVVNLNDVLTVEPHAQNTKEYIAEAQEIFQYNLNVIEKKLAKYKNKKQAQAYLQEAARQLQAQLDYSRNAAANALLVALQEILDSQKYAIVLPQSSVLKVDDALNITEQVKNEFQKVNVTLPTLPQKIENPDLPADKKK